MNPIDVIIVGEDPAGAVVADKLAAAGVRLVTVNSVGTPQPDLPYEQFSGRGVVTAEGQVTLLDPATGDERRILRSRAVVLALPAEAPLAAALGVQKFGLQSLADGTFKVSASGKSAVAWIYVVGGRAASDEPADYDLMVKELLNSQVEPASL